MDTALQSSVYVSSPEFAGWLMKRGFHVKFLILYLFEVMLMALFIVEKALEEAVGCITWCGNCLYG